MLYLPFAPFYLIGPRPARIPEVSSLQSCHESLVQLRDTRTETISTATTARYMRWRHTTRLAMMQRLQVGRPSSHFIRRLLQHRHPVRVRVNFCLRLLPARPLLAATAAAAPAEPADSPLLSFP